MVRNAMKVADELESEGIEASVTDMHTIKPFDSEAIEKDKKLIVTLEEHNIIGGLGSAVADALSQYTTHPKVLKLGINDHFVPVGSYKYLLQQCGLDIESVKNDIINNLK
jgi:transketolase